MRFEIRKLVFYEIEESWRSESDIVFRKSLPLTFYDYDSAEYILKKLKSDKKSLKYLLPYLQTRNSEFFIVKRKIKF